MTNNPIIATGLIQYGTSLQIFAFGVWLIISKSIKGNNHFIDFIYLSFTNIDLGSGRFTKRAGDTIFAIGALYLRWFVFGLNGGWTIKRE